MQNPLVRYPPKPGEEKEVWKTICECGAFSGSAEPNEWTKKRLTNAVDVFAAAFVATTTGHIDRCSQPRIGFGSRLADRTAASPTRRVKFHRVGRKAIVGAQNAGGTKQFAFLYTTRRTQTWGGGGGWALDAAAALRNNNRRRLLLLHSVKSGGAAGDGIELAGDVTRCAVLGEFQLGSETGAGRRRARSMVVAEQDHIELFVGWRCTVVTQATRTLVVVLVLVVVVVVVVRGGHQQQRRGTQQ